MKITARYFKVLSFALVFSLSVLPTAPAFAQLGDVTPTPVEAPPVSEPAPTPSTETPPTEPVVETIAPADTTTPVISGVANLSLGLGETTIAWTTDELAVSRLEYGTSPSYGQNATLDASALLAHTAILTITQKPIRLPYEYHLHPKLEIHR